jgi:hypothetical protein
MTYAFEWRMDHLQEGSEEVEKEMERLKGVSLLFLSFSFCTFPRTGGDG